MPFQVDVEAADELKRLGLELLLEMPDVGEDRDYERPEDRGRPVEP